jgi:SulP family sulfate permease
MSKSPQTIGGQARRRSANRHAGSAGARLPPWWRGYGGQDAAHDLVAGIVTCAVLAPQALGYAFLAGLPPEVGLYAGLLPPLVYALLGTSRVLAVGPVAVASILSAGVLGATVHDPAQLLPAAAMLAVLSGTVMLVLGVLRAGVLVNFISLPVLNGFTAGAGVLIMLSQLYNLLGIAAPSGQRGGELIVGAITALPRLHLTTPLFSLSVLAALLIGRRFIQPALRGLGIPRVPAAGAVLVWPMIVLVGTGLFARFSGIHLTLVGPIPRGLPQLGFPVVDLDLTRRMLPGAVLVALVSYLESVAIGRVLARRRRMRTDANRELIAVGAANVAAAMSLGMPVAGSFSRSTVADSAGARSPAAGMVTALALAASILLFGEALRWVPKAALAAIIVFAVPRLVDLRSLRRTWEYDRGEAAAWLLTAAVSFLFGVEPGLLLGAVLALLLHVWRSSQPHIAEVGLVPGTEQFRELDRHPELEIWPQLLLLRLDESLFFGNVARFEEFIAARLSRRPEVTDLILICSAVNAIDATGIETLEQLVETLGEAKVTLHLADLTGPIWDRLEDTELLRQLGERRVHASVAAAIDALAAPPI